MTQRKKTNNNSEEPKTYKTKKEIIFELIKKENNKIKKT